MKTTDPINIYRIGFLKAVLLGGLLNAEKRATELAMLASRRALVSLKLAGKLATTTNR